MLSRSILTILALGGLFACTAQLGNSSRTVSTPTVAMSSRPIADTSPTAQLSNQSKLTLNSIGNVHVGMTLAEASKAAGIPLISEEPVPESRQCNYAAPQPGIEGLDFMLDGDRIVRINVTGKSSISTLSGAKIGDTEARIKSLYPGQIKVTAHAFVSEGHYLTVVPKDAKDQAYRLIFETDGDRVTSFRSGKLPQVSWVEGCW